MVCRLGRHFSNKIELCVVMELNDTFKFNISEAYHILLEHRNSDHNLDSVTEAVLIGIYGFLIVVGILTNLLLSFVIARRPQMHTARNLYIVNLTISDITLCLICMPFTLVVILRRQWNLGLALCKLVPALQGTNTMVSVGTITVIALDRYYTIIKGQDGPTTRRRVIISIAVVWFLSVLASLPLIVFQVVEPMMFGQVVLYETCLEIWPNQTLKILYTIAILMIQAVIPAGVVFFIHAKIASYLHEHALTQRDSRRAQRELQRNKKTTMLLSGVAVLFAVSWLPLGLFSLWADLFIPADTTKESSVSPESFYVALAVCHVVAMSSAVSNPIVYGWLNSNIRREMFQLFSSRCSAEAGREGNGVGPTSTIMLCQNGQRPQHHPPATTYSAL